MGTKKPAVERHGGSRVGKTEVRLERFFDEPGFYRLDRDPGALGSTARQLDLDALQVRAEFAWSGARDVRADATALFALTFAVDDAALDGAFACDCADAGHGWNGLKGWRVKGGLASKQGDFYGASKTAMAMNNGHSRLRRRCATSSAVPSAMLTRGV